MRRSHRQLLRATTTRSLQIACALALAGAAAGARGAPQPLAWYRLGDDDPGAAAGNIGNDPTLDHTSNHFDLSRAGPPRYSGDVPPNVATSVIGADKLSMKFFNFTGPLDI